MDSEMESKKEEKQKAVCAAMFPKASLPFANKMAKDLKALKFEAEVWQDADPGFLIVSVKTNDAETTLKEMKRAGYDGYII